MDLDETLWIDWNLSTRDTGKGRKGKLNRRGWMGLGSGAMGVRLPSDSCTYPTSLMAWSHGPHDNGHENVM